MTKMNLFPLLFLIIFLIVKIEQTNEKLQQKSFGEIFGEKWEEKEVEKLKEKSEIIGKYLKIKEKIKQKKRKYLAKEWNKIDVKIAKKLGTNRNKIYEWIKELGLNQKINNSHKSKTDEEKSEIVQKYISMANEYKQKRKYSSEEWYQNYIQISKKIGVSRTVIEKWKRKFGIYTRRITEKEKMEKMKIYWQIKKENPKMSDKEIAKTMKMNNKSISKWKKQKEMNEMIWLVYAKFTFFFKIFWLFLIHLKK